MSRITLVMAGNEEGGLEKHVVELAEGLVQQGLSVSLIAHPKYQARLSSHINFIAVDLAKSRRNPFVLYELYQAIKTLKPDLVHVHGNKAAAMVGSLLKWLKIASVSTLHSRKKNVKMFAPYDCVIAVSQYAAENLQHPCVRVVHNGVRLPNNINPTQKVIQHEVPQVLAIGRLVEVKGFDLLIKAWKGMPAQLLIAGEGDEYAMLDELIVTEGLQDKVTLLGHRTDVLELLQQSDLHVISSHYEGGPYTLAESLLMHTPVVSTRVGIAPDFIPAEFLCEAGSVKELHDTLIHALAERSVLPSHFQIAFERAQQELTLARMVEQVTVIYEDTIRAYAAHNSKLGTSKE